MSNYNQQPEYQQQPGYQQQPPVQPQWPHMTIGNWIGTSLLMLIPIANIVLIFVWAFGSNVNPSKKSYFRASLILMAIGIILSIVLWGVIYSFVMSIINQM